MGEPRANDSPAVVSCTTASQHGTPSLRTGSLNVDWTRRYVPLHVQILHNFTRTACLLGTAPTAWVLFSSYLYKHLPGACERRLTTGQGPSHELSRRGQFARPGCNPQIIHPPRPGRSSCLSIVSYTEHNRHLFLPCFPQQRLRSESPPETQNSTVRDKRAQLPGPCQAILVTCHAFAEHRGTILGSPKELRPVSRHSG